jgi:hypothetical protein
MSNGPTPSQLASWQLTVEEIVGLLVEMEELVAALDTIAGATSSKRRTLVRHQRACAESLGHAIYMERQGQLPLFEGGSS